MENSLKIPPGYLTPADRQTACDLILSSGADLILALKKCKYASQKTHSLSGTWSPAQIGEHLILAEIALMKTVHKALQNPIQSDWQARTAGKDKLLSSQLAPGNGSAVSPAALVPVENLDLETIIDRFQALRLQTIEFVNTCNAPLHAHTLPNKFFGELSAYQWILYIGYHTQRHIHQLEQCA